MSIDLDVLVQTMRITAGHMAPVVLMPHEARALVAEVERLRAEVDRERAAVVAWLREVADAPVAWVDDAIRDAALGIERGEHRHKDDRTPD